MENFILKCNVKTIGQGRNQRAISGGGSENFLGANIFLTIYILSKLNIVKTGKMDLLIVSKVYRV